MGITLINFPESLYDVRYRDEWPLQMYIEDVDTSSKQQMLMSITLTNQHRWG
jgi:hypothetical protein